MALVSWLAPAISRAFLASRGKIVSIRMFSTRQGDKIYQSVIVSNSVDMVNMHSSRQNTVSIFPNFAMLRIVALNVASWIVWHVKQNIAAIENTTASPPWIGFPVSCCMPIVASRIWQGITSKMFPLAIRFSRYFSLLLTSAAAKTIWRISGHGSVRKSLPTGCVSLYKAPAKSIFMHAIPLDRLTASAFTFFHRCNYTTRRAW